MTSTATPAPDVAGDPFPAIGDYGAVGNLETVALIATNGAVEYLPYPQFDAETLFAAMLDRHAGRFRVCPDFAETGTQRYLADTNVLVTRFAAQGKVVEVTDFMPVGSPARANQLVRIVECRTGEATITACCSPRFDYARGETRARLRPDGAAVFDGDGGRWPVRLVADAPLRLEGSEAWLTARLREGERIVLNLVCDNAETDLLSAGEVDDALADTARFWRGWIASATWTGRWRDAVMRSALALKLMVSDRNGSLVAAPTFGLPEAIGEHRNWDYRYCWIRDSAFTIYALLRVGLTGEADRYRAWVADRLAGCGDGSLRLMYRLDGGTEGLRERTLDHLSGYRGSRPVRIGNDAFRQTQLDIYGEMVDSLYLAHKYLGGATHELFEQLRLVVDYVCANWRRPGSGIWEMRGEPQEFIDARIMSWVTVDRAIRLAHKTSFQVPGHWPQQRQAIARSVHEDFWNPDIGAFTQVKGGDRVDAVALLMPLLKFCPPDDPRFCSTMDVIEARLVNGAFVRRYEPPDDSIEGIEGDREGCFVACSFWWIECLARCGRTGEAVARMEQMLDHASPLGLFSEEIDFDGTHLGNTPQALSHLALISAAVAVNRSIDNGGQQF
jgi:GH15 family glucan-1,4-alpha-glucosidase